MNRLLLLRILRIQASMEIGYFISLPDLRAIEILWTISGSVNADMAKAVLLINASSLCSILPSYTLAFKNESHW